MFWCSIADGPQPVPLLCLPRPSHRVNNLANFYGTRCVHCDQVTGSAGIVMNKRARMAVQIDHLCMPWGSDKWDLLSVTWA